MHGQRPLVSIRDKEKRALADNRGTIMGSLADLRPSCEAAFISHYVEIRRICRELPDADGAAVIAVDDQGVAAVAFLPRTRETPQVTIVARHGKAELWLQSSSVALRHIAIVTCPGEPSEPVRYRVLDLRTRSGLIDERGQPLRSFEADGTSWEIRFTRDRGLRIVLRERRRNGEAAQTRYSACCW